MDNPSSAPVDTGAYVPARRLSIVVVGAFPAPWTLLFPCCVTVTAAIPVELRLVLGNLFVDLVSKILRPQLSAPSRLSQSLTLLAMLLPSP